MLLSWWAGRLVLMPGTLQRETNFNHFNFNETNFATLRCDCSLVSCYCCGGYDVQLNFASLSSLDLSSSVKFLSNACSGLSCESINNSNGKKLVRFNHVEKPLGLFNAIHIANEKLLQSNETHTVLHSHPPSYFAGF